MLIFLSVFRVDRSEMEWMIKRAGAGASQTKTNEDAVVKLRGLPFGCTKEDIAHFFSGMLYLTFCSVIFHSLDRYNFKIILTGLFLQEISSKFIDILLIGGLLEYYIISFFECLEELILNPLRIFSAVR